MTPQRIRLERRGVTLLEGIVIAVVLLIVAAVLFPVFTTCGGGMATACLSNVKRLATSAVIYQADWNDRFPDRDRWMDAILPYLPNNHAYGPAERCPAIVQESEKNPNLYGYAFNSTLSHADGSKVPDPAEKPLLYDSVNLARNASDPFLSIPNPPRNHKGTKRNNVAFVDGHARSWRLPAKP